MPCNIAMRRPPSHKNQVTSHPRLHIEPPTSPIRPSPCVHDNPWPQHIPSTIALQTHGIVEETLAMARWSIGVVCGRSACVKGLHRFASGSNVDRSDGRDRAGRGVVPRRRVGSCWGWDVGLFGEVVMSECRLHDTCFVQRVVTYRCEEQGKLNREG
jgi:hypothetical protein